MKNIFSRTFRSMLEWFRPARRIQTEQSISPEQFQKMLAQTLADPGFRRLLMKTLVGPIVPIEGGTCTAAEDVAAGQFGAHCTGTDFSFPGKVGIGTTSPAFRWMW